MNKTINKVAKGRKVENIARDELKKEGWLIDKKVRTRFSSPDFFGQFDLLAIKSEITRYVQIKSNKSDFYTAKREIKKWMIENNLFINAEVWLYLGKKDKQHQWRQEIIYPYTATNEKI